MKIAFRTDASIEIGTGHVMRCLTLADALRQKGAQCYFICREHTGNLIEFIHQQNFKAYGLPVKKIDADEAPDFLEHATWLGANWKNDAEETRSRLHEIEIDWLVVDHYALDIRWEKTLRSSCRHIMVIDDLADRYHDCDLLLDQNLGRKESSYLHLLPTNCKILTSPQYALLRPEFASYREHSLARRAKPQLKQILITMGGIDKDNATYQVLETLKKCNLPADCKISVVMGRHAPWLKQIQILAKDMPWPTEVAFNIDNMAQRMADSDLAIGAAGSTSWERCCLGLPALMLVLADNQLPAAQALDKIGAAHLIGKIQDITIQLPLAISMMQEEQHLTNMSNTARAITTGFGTHKILDIMEEINV